MDLVVVHEPGNATGSAPGGSAAFGGALYDEHNFSGAGQPEPPVVSALGRANLSQFYVLQRKRRRRRR